MAQIVDWHLGAPMECAVCGCLVLLVQLGEVLGVVVIHINLVAELQNKSHMIATRWLSFLISVTASTHTKS